MCVEECMYMYLHACMQGAFPCYALLWFSSYYFYSFYSCPTIKFVLVGWIFSSPEPKAHGELIVYQSSRRPSVRVCVRPSVRLSTLSNIIISTTSRRIPTKFYLKHHWGGGKASLGFGSDRFGTLVSMATESPHRVIMGKILLAL